MTDLKPHDAIPLGHPAVHQGHYCRRCLLPLTDPIHRGVVRWDLSPKDELR
jgi:hypothetical protein